MNAITRAAIEAIAANARLQATSPTVQALAKLIEAEHPGAIERARARRQRERFEAKFTGDPPAWVKRYVEKHASSLRALRWHRSRIASFHGTCYGHGEVSITVPEPFAGHETDARILVLHELAHHANWLGGNHDDRFYDAMYSLLVAERLYRAALARDWTKPHSLRRAASRARFAA